MALRQLDLRGFTGNRRALRDALPRPTDEQDRSSEAVAAVVAEVRADGDSALRRLTRQFDGVDLDELRVEPAEIQAALARIPVALQEALDVAHDRILAYHAHESADPEVGDFESGGIEVRHLVRPVARAGCYAPGGRARYPSTVLMCAVPAQVAGVGEIVLCVPPGPDGRIDDASLAAAAVAGIDEVYRVGGAQAIAAMAYGTESIEAVDVIVGPGNRYVAEAKRQVSGVVGVASAFAGPSEVVVIAGPGTPTELAAIDLVVQAEHGPDGLAWLVTWSEAVAEAVTAQVERIVSASPRRDDLRATLGAGGYVVLVDGPKQAVAVANVVAPEHLEILTHDAALAPRPGDVGRGGVPRARLAGQRGGLPGRTQPRPPHQPERTVRQRAPGGRLPSAHPRGVGQREGPRGTGAPRRDAGRDRGSPRPRRVGAPAMAAVEGGGVEEPDLPPVRPDLVELTGYHSAQVEVEVRLNTNESPIPPPDGWLEEFRAGLGAIDFNRYPDREARELRRDLAASHGVRPEQVFCANGSNEILQSLLLAYGGPGRTVALFEPTYTMHRQIARTTGTTVAAGRRTDDHRLDLDEVRRVTRGRAAGHHLPVLAEQPLRPGRPPGAVGGGVGVGPGPHGGGRGLRPVRPLVGPRPPPGRRTGGAAGGGGADLLQDVVHGRDAPRLPGGRPRGRARLCTGRAALPSRCGQAAGRTPGPPLRPTRWRPGWRSSGRSGDGSPPDWPPSPSRRGPPTPTSSSSARVAVPARKVWSHLLDRSVLVRDCSEWPGLTGCLRVTVGLPEENDRFLAALDESLR